MLYTNFYLVYKKLGDGYCRDAKKLDGIGLPSYTLAFNRKALSTRSQCEKVCNERATCAAIEFQPGYCNGFVDVGDGFFATRPDTGYTCWLKTKIKEEKQGEWKLKHPHERKSCYIVNYKLLRDVSLTS